MGSITLLLPKHLPTVALSTLQESRFAHGFEQTIDISRATVEGDRLVVDFDLNESGYAVVPWPTGSSGTLVAMTSTLRLQREPYRLMLELARGKLNQVRTQVAEWQGIGLVTPRSFDRALIDTSRMFGKAVHSEPDESDELAKQVLELSFALGDQLTTEFSCQLLATRLEQSGPLDTMLAARTLSGWDKQPNAYTEAFNAAQFAVSWRDVEPVESRYDWSALDRAVAAAQAAGLPITIGPVIDLAPELIPAWVANWEGDFPTLAAYMCDFLETTIRRYLPAVRRWVICAGFNNASAVGLNDDERLRLAFRLFEAAGHVDAGLDLILSVAQPWGDYLSNEDQTISPLTFPDDLLRTGLKVSAVELEIRTGTAPRGSLPRDLLDTARLISLYGGLGLPIELSLSYPASTETDPHANPSQTLWKPAWIKEPTPERQADWGESLTLLGICMPHVRAVTWDNWSDAELHLTPSGGILDGAHSPKPLLSRLHTLRNNYLAKKS